MLKKLPLSQALEKIFAGSGECAEVGWTFLGLSIAGWALLWFVLFGGYAMYLALIGMRRARPKQRF
jgi:disulfide bond formation protein DsbB